jgi:hypothetical protein
MEVSEPGFGDVVVDAWWTSRPAAWCGVTGVFMLNLFTRPAVSFLVVRVRYRWLPAVVNRIVVNSFFYEYMLRRQGPAFIQHPQGDTGRHPDDDPNQVQVEFCTGRTPVLTVRLQTNNTLASFRATAEPVCGKCNDPADSAADCVAGCGHMYHVACAEPVCAVCGQDTERAFAKP